MDAAQRLGCANGALERVTRRGRQVAMDCKRLRSGLFSAARLNGAQLLKAVQPAADLGPAALLRGLLDGMPAGGRGHVRAPLNFCRQAALQKCPAC